MAVSEKTKMDVQELGKEDTPLEKAMDWLPSVVLFITIANCVPWFLESSVHMGVFLGALGFFSFLNTFIVPSISEKYFGKKFTKEKQKLEMENRLVSLVFNISTGIPSYLCWMNMFPLVQFSELESSRTLIMDVFNAWSLGYVLYDFLTLTKVYGKGAALIQWHHVGEGLVCYCYVIAPHLASLYLLGGGLMQLSSGILHIQRVFGWFPNLPSSITVTWKWFLTCIWAHARLWGFPLCMSIVYRANHVTVIHGLLLLTGTVLTVMNVHWQYKIYRMKSLAF